MVFEELKQRQSVAWGSGSFGDAFRRDFTALHERDRVDGGFSISRTYLLVGTRR